jgi:hypothetical protein
VRWQTTHGEHVVAGYGQIADGVEQCAVKVEYE